MKQKLPLSFYLKVMFIVLVLGGGYLSNRSLIDTTIANENLSAMESMNVILQGVMGMQGNIKPEPPVTSPVDEVAFPGNITPQLITEDVKNLPNYQLAQQRAEGFNQSFNADQVNDLFNQSINEFRLQSGTATMSVAPYLAEGARARALELGLYNYLSSNTVEGNAFYNFLPEISEPQYRLGENLYELYISSDDIHLETWQNSEILADYLYSVFRDSLETDLYQNYHGTYVWVHAEPTDYQIDKASYVRLVVVLLLDTQSD